MWMTLWYENVDTVQHLWCKCSIAISWCTHEMYDYNDAMHNEMTHAWMKWCIWCDAFDMVHMVWCICIWTHVANVMMHFILMGHIPLPFCSQYGGGKTFWKVTVESHSHTVWRLRAPSDTIVWLQHTRGPRFRHGTIGCETKHHCTEERWKQVTRKKIKGKHC
jgi:hypothetical protein